MSPGSMTTGSAAATISWPTRTWAGRSPRSISTSGTSPAPTGRSSAGQCGSSARLAGAGIRQFLDIGSGIPTQGNVHEVAQQANQGARVVYADIDPVAIAHGKAILAGHENTAIIEAVQHASTIMAKGR